jgi:hypothetical protein
MPFEKISVPSPGPGGAQSSILGIPRGTALASRFASRIAPKLPCALKMLEETELYR